VEVREPSGRGEAVLPRAHVELAALGAATGLVQLHERLPHHMNVVDIGKLESTLKHIRKHTLRPLVFLFVFFHKEKTVPQSMKQTFPIA
jgi:hypothetical protein